MYKYQFMVGYGSNTQIYFATSTVDNKKVCIKIDTNKEVHLRKTKKEFQILKILNQHKKLIRGVPKVFQHEQFNDRSILVMERLGISVEDFFIQKSKKFKIETVLEICTQILQKIQFLHQNGIVHGDIKPDNFMFGIKKYFNKIFMIDFGLSNKFILENGTHIKQKYQNYFAGNLRFSSFRMHEGYNISRKDDLESFCYVFIYLLSGSLPWQNLAIDPNQKIRVIGELKKQNIQISKFNVKINELINNMIIQTRNLKFEEAPNYEYYKGMINKITSELIQ